MSDKSISECQSKIDPGIPKTGRKSVNQSGKEPQTVAKEAPPTLDAAPKTESLTPSQEAPLCSPSRTLTTTPKTASRKTSGRCASGATSPTTPDIMQKQESDARALSVTTSNRRSLVGKNKSAERSKELQRVLRNDESQMTLYQIQLEQWKPFNDRVKASVEIWGSSAKCKGGEHTVRAKQIAAAAQASGLNDPYASPGQRLMMATALYKGQETYDFAFQQGLDKTEWKKQWGDMLGSVAEFFGLGNKKAVAARNKRKAA